MVLKAVHCLLWNIGSNAIEKKLILKNMECARNHMAVADIADLGLGLSNSVPS